jgi:hypothetical protein
MDILEIVGWVVANLIVPYLVPIGLLRAVQKFPHIIPAVATRPMITEALKDGQLSLTCLAIVAVAEYEIWPEMAGAASLKICFWVLVILGMVALYYVVLGTVCPAPLGEHPMNFKQWFQAYPVGKQTIFLSVMVTAVFASAHFVIEYGHTHRAVAANQSNTEIRTVERGNDTKTQQKETR